MVSLHCAATVLVRHPVDALDEIGLLAQRRIAGIFATEPEADHVRDVARDLGLAVSRIAVTSGEGWGFAHLNEDVLQEISDVHRGESVLVLVSGEHPVEAMEIEIGDDGMRVLKRD